MDVTIGAGMFGLLGPNGAGKSSLMRTMATLQLPDSGQLFFNGQDIFANKLAFRKKLGYLPQSFGVYPKSSAYRLLDYFAHLKGISAKKERQYAIDRVLELTNLTDVQHKAVHTYSGGMRQRFGIAQLLLNDPQLIIVDEPTAGLDPAERSRFLNVLRRIGNDNIVIFSTHLVEDVKDLCHDMLIMNKGKQLAQIEPKSAIASLKGKIWETQLQEQDLAELKIEHQLLSQHYNEQNKLIQRLYSDAVTHELIRSTEPSLEDFYFLSLKKQQS